MGSVAIGGMCFARFRQNMYSRKIGLHQSPKTGNSSLRIFFGVGITDFSISIPYEQGMGPCKNYQLHQPQHQAINVGCGWAPRSQCWKDIVQQWPEFGCSNRRCGCRYDVDVGEDP